MTSSEVMQCAAILAAGILSGRKPENEASAEEAVALMKEIADRIKADSKQSTWTF